MQTAIEVTSLSKLYGETIAVADVSFSLASGEILVLIGPSGCGKTTTLRLLAGLEHPSDGVVNVGGQHVAGGGVWVPPEQRRIGMVFQDYALFPHLTAAQNIAFALKGQSFAQRKERTRYMLTLVELDELADRYPHQLSGGEQQRVALARALAPKPIVLLLDEPFSNLDAALRKSMRASVLSILRKAKTTAVFVTHDQEEALELADTVAVMRNGRLQQIGSPREVYLLPTSASVAAFLGEANFLPGIASGETVHCALGELKLVSPHKGKVRVLIRPESLILSSPTGISTATVEAIRFLGHDQLVDLRLSSGEVLQARVTPYLELAQGMQTKLSVRQPLVAYPAD
ncbi:MAG: ABC transporter ATP-binding protein [Chloroflexi bacterium]|nr:ABC transporter ATP-binding protein [Chloroflexota bacterium]